MTDAPGYLHPLLSDTERRIYAPKADALLWAIDSALTLQPGGVEQRQKWLTELCESTAEDDGVHNHPLWQVFLSLLGWTLHDPSFPRLEEIIDHRAYYAALTGGSEPRPVSVRNAHNAARHAARYLTDEKG